MLDRFTSTHQLDVHGKPAGGTTTGTGISISWQDGPLGRGEDRKEPNGAFVETLLAIVRDRIMFYTTNGFGCDENDRAVVAIDEALEALAERTQRREAEGTEGTHEGS